MNKDIEYVNGVLDGKINAPRYVKKQCAVYQKIFDGLDENYTINISKRNLIIEITKLLYIPRGLSAGKTVFDTLSGFQWLFIFAVQKYVYHKKMSKGKVDNEPLTWGIISLN